VLFARGIIAQHFFNQSNNFCPFVVSSCSMDIRLYTGDCGAKSEQKIQAAIWFNRRVAAEKSRQMPRSDSAGFRSLRRRKPKT
jgi:hypothetical protein